MHESDAAGARYAADIEALADDDLLALAYSFSQNEERLRVYLRIFRARTGERAQLSACLLCFDLARRGDAVMVSQFGYLRGTLKALAQDDALVERLTGNHAYLCQVWLQCAAVLADDGDGQNDTLGQAAAHDAPGAAEAWGFLRPADAPLVGAIDLLSDDDLPAANLEVDVGKMWALYESGCADFFGSGGANPSYDASMGFRLASVQGQARAQAYLQALDQCQHFVPPARGMRPLVLLAWGLSLRSRSLLGQVNRRRQHLLALGLVAFEEALGAMGSVAGVLGPLYSEPRTWTRISDLLMDYVCWRRGQGQESSTPQALATVFVQHHMLQ